ncbi:MAG: GDP-mannose 4,6-dehydratase [Xanthobacteraceae bacterium]
MSAPAHHVFVTGTGFVSRWLAEVLAPRAGVRTTVAGLCPPSPIDGVEAIRLDITDAPAVNEAVKAVRPTAVVHLAAIANPREAREAPHRAWAVNLDGTYALAEAVLRHAPAARFIYVSTSEIYGDQYSRTGVPLDEATLLDPTNPYAASKAAADLLVGQLARDGLNCIRVRPFNHTGPRQSESYVVPALAAQIAAIELGRRPATMRVYNLNSRRDFTDVRDVVRAYAQLSVGALEFAPGLVLNLASGVPRRVGDILDQLTAQAKADIAIEPEAAPLRQGDHSATCGDARRAQQLLGWHPSIPWETTLADVLDYWRSRMS